MLYRLTKQQRVQIVRSSDLYFIMHPILRKIQSIDKMKEHLFVIGLKTNAVVMFVDLVSIGTVSTTLASGREVFKAAIIKSATSIVICHNHPSENCQPSEADKIMTWRMVELGKELDIKVLDSIILTMNCGYFSFADEELLQMPN